MDQENEGQEQEFKKFGMCYDMGFVSKTPNLIICITIYYLFAKPYNHEVANNAVNILEYNFRKYCMYLYPMEEEEDLEGLRKVN